MFGAASGAEIAHNSLTCYSDTYETLYMYTQKRIFVTTLFYLILLNYCNFIYSFYSVDAALRVNFSKCVSFLFCEKWEHIRCCRLANKTANNVEMIRVEWQSGQKVKHSQVRHTQTSSSPVSPAACKHTPETTPESSASSLPPTCLPEDRQHEQSTVTLEMKRSKKTEKSSHQN